MHNQQQRRQVNGRDGMLGWVDPKEQPADHLEVLIRLENGQSILVPADLLIPQDDGTLYLPMSREQFIRSTTSAAAPGRENETVRVIPVIVEELDVKKRMVETGRVRIHKTVSEREERIDTQRWQERVDVERVPVNRMVDTAPEQRQEGETLIIPVLEEVYVIEKRLRLKEEIRVTRKREVVNEPQSVTLRSEEVTVDRISKDSDPVGRAGDADTRRQRR
jgi:uncharacterized protein (TIGR02271 family)